MTFRMPDDPADVALFRRYVTWEPDPTSVRSRIRHYNQNSAIGALLHLDQKLGTDHAQRFIVPEGLWHQSTFADQDPLDCQRETEQLCRFADHLMNN